MITKVICGKLEVKVTSYELIGVEWEEKPKISTDGLDLILTIGALTSKTIECSISKSENIGCVIENETGRTCDFLKIQQADTVWARMPKTFDSASLPEMTQMIKNLNFRSIMILEAQASQVAGISPGLFQISYPKQDQVLPNLPYGCAAQGNI